MANYTTIFKLMNNLYCKSSPVLIKKGELLIDVISGQVIAQFSITNISERIISGVTMDIRAFDSSGNEVTGLFQYPYLRVNARPNVDFGAEESLFMPDPSTKTCMVSITSVSFSDGDKWEMPNNEVWLPVPEPDGINEAISDEGLIAQYKRETSSRAQFAPAEYEDLWICSCGRINKNDADDCATCHCEREQVFNALNVEYLQKKKEEYDIEQAEEKERREKEEAERKEKAKKTAKTTIKVVAIVAILVALAVAGFFIYKHVSTNNKYNEAIELGKAGEYDKAIEQLESIDPYKDSAKYINTFKADALIESTDGLIADGKYDEITNDAQWIDSSDLPSTEQKTLEQICSYAEALSLLDIESDSYKDINSYGPDEESTLSTAITKLEEADGYGQSEQLQKMISDNEKYVGEWEGTATIDKDMYHEVRYTSSTSNNTVASNNKTMEIVPCTVTSGILFRNDMNNDGFDDDTGEKLPTHDIECDAEGLTVLGVKRTTEGQENPNYEVVIGIRISFDTDLYNYCDYYVGELSPSEVKEFKIYGTDDYEESDYATLKMDEKSIEGKSKNKTSFKLKKQ